MTTREAVVAEARSWLGTPYHHMGRIKGKGGGTDCGQILIAVYSAVGLCEAFDPGYYPLDWHCHRSEERYLGFVKQRGRPTQTPKPGDIALFRFGRCISHGAIVIEWPLLIHAYIRRGVVYAHADDAELAGRLAGFWTVFED